MNLKKLEELEQLFTEMGEEIERLKNQPVNKKRWRAEKDEVYYLVTGGGAVTCYHENCDRTDNYQYGTGNYFRTEEEAKLRRDRDLATQRVLDALREAEGDWAADWDDKEQCKCRPYIDHDKSIQIWWGYLDLTAPTEWHSSEAAWQQVIKSHKSDIWLMITGERCAYFGHASMREKSDD